MRRIHHVTILLTALVAALLMPIASAQQTENRELYRIRILNTTGGYVEVSEARPESRYYRVGKVTRPATANTKGFSASAYAQPGTVAATAVHGIRIKVSGRKDCHPEQSRIISVLPKEFASAPKGFGGHVAGTSGIYTDIPTGDAIFRNLSPFVGNAVYLVKHGEPAPLPDGYTPREGDQIVVIVSIPVRYPKEIVFWNRRGGTVEAVYTDGRETIATVQHPVGGVGRFDATGYTGVGCINTNHSGVVTISTAPIAQGDKDGAAVETRGGFMIQPSRHAATARELSQILVVKPADASRPWLEGSPPLFCGHIGLAYDPLHEENSFRAEMKTRASGWTPFPALVGRHDQALEKLPGGLGTVSEIRIRFPEFSPDGIRAAIERSQRAYLEICRARAIATGTLVRDTTVSFALPGPGLERISYTRLYVDGELAGISNEPGHSFFLNAGRFEEGEHSAMLCGVDQNGETVKEARHTFFVQGTAPPASGR